MPSYDLIIIGGGAAAAAAALGAPVGRTLVVDVGIQAEPAPPLPRPSRLEALAEPQADMFDLVIGQQFEGTGLVGGRSTLSPKLKAPQMRFITRDWEKLSPVRAAGFAPQMSFALGGLANGWGAGVYRFNQRDLASFPLTESMLTPYFDRLTRHIGVSGENDNLERFFGSPADLLPSLRMNRGPRLIYHGYQQHREAFARRGFHVGRPRLAVLSRDYDGRSRYPYHNLEFFTSKETSIYTPTLTLQKLQAEGKIEYAGGLLVEEYTENPGEVMVRARRLRNGETVHFTSKAILVAAGCLNTVKIVLTSEKRPNARLPLLDNQVSYVPICHPGLIGLRSERRCFGMGQLNIVYDGPAAAEPIQGTLYDLSGPLRSDILMDFPLSITGKLAAARYLMQSMCLVQYFYPDDPRVENYVGLSGTGELDLHYNARAFGKVERETLKAFRKLGWFGLPWLCKYPPPGSSYHYAGSLPMKTNPGPLETDSQGRLAGHQRVFIADSSVFSRLPSKNLTFTSMANSMRIAEHIRSLMP